MSDDDNVKEIRSVLERRTSITAYEDLVRALHSVGPSRKLPFNDNESSSITLNLETKNGTDCDARSVEGANLINSDLSDIAFGIDTNALLEMAKDNSKALAVIDYLIKYHDKPIILPGQVIQEFWNNKASIMKEATQDFRDAVNDFKNRMKKIGNNFDDYVKQIDVVLKEFLDEHGGTYTDRRIDNIKNSLKRLQVKASVHFCPREGFYEISCHRRNTKTPPGYKDKDKDSNCDGDFFVWVDFLYGLKVEENRKNRFKKIVFVTNEKKTDWRTGDTAHPILVSEVRAIFGVPFDVWSYDQFAERIEKEISLIPEKEA